MKIDLDSIYCGSIKRGDIFLISGEADKIAVVVQDNILNERLSTVLAVPVSQHKEGAPTFKNELLLKPSETSLKKWALCLPHKLCAVDRHRLRAKTGELHPDRLQELFDVMDINFGRFRDK